MTQEGLLVGAHVVSGAAESNESYQLEELKTVGVFRVVILPEIRYFSRLIPDSNSHTWREFLVPISQPVSGSPRIYN